MKTLASPGKFPFVLAALCLLFFMPFLGAVHLFDWDEINFAECSREMLLTGEYLRVYKDFEPFHEKPPLFFWLQSISMWLWGLNEYAARFPNAVCGFFTLYLLYLIGKRLYSNTFGIIWAMAYFGSLLPHLYFRSGIIDPWFNFFIFLSLYLFLEYYWLSQGWLAKPLVKNKWLLLFLSASSMGLAILTKGQVAFILVCICFFFYWIVQRFRLFISIPAFLFFTISSFLGMGLWLGIETLQNGTWFVKEFIVYQLRLASEQDAGHGGFFGYHFVVLLFGCFPVSFFALLSYRKSKQEDAKQKDMHLWMLLLLSVVLLVFTLVRTKIVHYSSLAYFPLSFLGARALYQLHTKEFKLPKWLIISLFGFGILIAVLLIAAPFVAMQKELLQSWMRKDAFAVANLEANVQWTGIESLAGTVLLAFLLASLFFYRKQEAAKAFLSLCLGIGVLISTSLFFFINKVEAYSQNAAIEFLKGLANKNALVETYGYKSYAHLFYTQKQDNKSYHDWLKKNHPDSIPQNPKMKIAFMDALFTGEAVFDKEVYFITKITKVQEISRFTLLKKVAEKNGFVLLKRELPLPVNEFASDSIYNTMNIETIHF